MRQNVREELEGRQQNAKNRNVDHGDTEGNLEMSLRSLLLTLNFNDKNITTTHNKCSSPKILTSTSNVKG